MQAEETRVRDEIRQAGPLAALQRLIAENDALTAIKYARSKKLTKAKRKGVLGAGKFGAFVVGAAAGATLGSVVPVAGTVAGGAIGAVSLSAVASAGLTMARLTGEP